MRLIPLLIITAACAHRAPAKEMPPPAASAETGARVMVLGVYHFDNPGLDVVTSDLDDHTSAKRQAEIAEVLDALAEFAPTVILVESTRAEYTPAEPLSASEVDQLGVRLARQLGLPGVSGIDAKLDMDFDRLIAAANEANDRVFLDAFERTLAEVQAEVDAQSTRTVRENLLAMNDPGRFQRDGDIYLQMARVKHGDDFAGPDVLAAWYQRNFRIFANLAAHVTSDDDRVLVIYGAGHGAILRELVRAAPNMALVEPNDYLR
jgi:hypothetical protein